MLKTILTALLGLATITSAHAAPNPEYWAKLSGTSDGSEATYIPLKANPQFQKLFTRGNGLIVIQVLRVTGHGARTTTDVLAATVNTCRDGYYTWIPGASLANQDGHEKKFINFLVGSGTVSETEGTSLCDIIKDDKE